MKCLIILTAILFLSCGNNSDKYYENSHILQRIETELNQSIPEYKKNSLVQFENEMGNTHGYFIVDLNDTLNHTNFINTEKRKKIEFIDGHFYHICPTNRNYSFSQILFYNKGLLMFFTSVNCRNRGDSIDDVLAFAETQIDNKDEKYKILENIKNYRQFNRFSKVEEDPMAYSILCDCRPCN